MGRLSLQTVVSNKFNKSRIWRGALTNFSYISSAFFRCN